MASRFKRVKSGIGGVLARAKQRLEARRQSKIKKLEDRIAKLKKEIEREYKLLNNALNRRSILLKKGPLSEKEKSLLAIDGELVLRHRQRIHYLKNEISILESSLKRLSEKKRKN
ncbi:MAG: hypothetical protein N3F05_02870 [Candidatus Diapherotrites archaeon]|nr:hypothetical protein [Candidatus Diapherotrites archaeon]